MHLFQVLLKYLRWFVSPTMTMIMFALTFRMTFPLMPSQLIFGPTSSATNELLMEFNMLSQRAASGRPVLKSSDNWRAHAAVVGSSSEQSIRVFLTFCLTPNATYTTSTTKFHKRNLHFFGRKRKVTSSWKVTPGRWMGGGVVSPMFLWRSMLPTLYTLRLKLLVERYLQWNKSGPSTSLIQRLQGKILLQRLLRICLCYLQDSTSRHVKRNESRPTVPPSEQISSIRSYKCWAEVQLHPFQESFIAIPFAKAMSTQCQMVQLVSTESTDLIRELKETFLSHGIHPFA